MLGISQLLPGAFTDDEVLFRRFPNCYANSIAGSSGGSSSDLQYCMTVGNGTDGITPDRTLNPTLAGVGTQDNATTMTMTNGYLLEASA